MKKKKFPNIRYILISVFMMVIAFVLLYEVRINSLYASCIVLDDIPLDSMEQSAPGIVMFVIDDSGSMDWEFSCKAGNDGKFEGTYAYIFNDSNATDDNAYPSSDSNGKILEGSSATNKWKSQWSVENRLYYDPAATYTPWPTYSDANLNNPRSDPSISTYTLNLSGEWYDFGEPTLTTASLINAGAVFVDNEDTAASQGLATEVIMDNDNGRNDILWYGQNFGSFSPSATSGASWGSSDDPSDFQTNYLYTGTQNRTYTAEWSFINLVAGKYDVYAWWVAGSNRSQNVQYTINGSTVVTVNQEANGGKWNPIASDVNFGTSGSVVLTHTNPSNNNNRACADAIKLVPQFSSTTPIPFEQTAPSPTAWALIDDSTAYKRPQDSDANYLRANTDGTYTAKWTANNLVPSQLYDVYALWVGDSSHSTSVHYYTDHSGGTEDTTVSQRVSTGKWTKIAGGTDGISFTNGKGVVRLNHYTGGSTSRVCADAVAFVPHSPLNVKIHRAHYYTENANGRYLVDIDGSIKYYKYTDVNNDNIATGNELLLLDSAEAAAAGIVTGRTYTQERQNFANWYSFYRRRELTAKNAISKVITDMEGVYIGLLSIHYGDSYGGIRQHALPVKVTINDTLLDQSNSLLTTLFSMDSDGGTPLRVGLKNIGEYFKGNYGKPSPLPSTDFASNTYPFFIADKGGTCQQAFAIVMTDGYWNDSYSGVDNADKDDSKTQIDGFDGSPFEDTYSNTLADVAMHYYENDLNTTLNNDVPTNASDTADHQHLVTYTLSFGVEGSIDRDLYPNCPDTVCSNPPCCPTWTDPTAANINKIDDMFHAAINGRGKYVNASSPQEMVDAMNELKQDIQSRLGSSAALATNSIQRQVGTVIYQGTYNTAGWFGEVSALPVGVETGAVGTAMWQASAHVPEWQNRRILSYDGTNGIDFYFNNISSAQETQLENNGHIASQIVDFIRGDISNTVTNGGTLRARINPIGDIVHSAPTYYNGMVYIGANDGMLHAIDAANGEERFCYVPGMVYDHLSDLAIPAYSHRYYVDGTPVVGKIGNQDILVCGLGKGGKGYFALDVTKAATTGTTAEDVLWELPTAADDDMGYAFSNANIVNTEAEGKVVIFGNGYDSVNQKAVLYIITKPETKKPTVIKLDTQAGSCNGLSSPKVVDVDADGDADYAFAGDLLGNMWKFDLRGAASDWKVYYNSADYNGFGGDHIQ
ncbi:MAG: PQQ-binding-like beta-propeller repeat protein [Desulfamplus sp.]|nr:PQQ-binding-like beta-propeller repeat protein [Desulfamplus sp.]